MARISAASAERIQTRSPYETSPRDPAPPFDRRRIAELRDDMRRAQIIRARREILTRAVVVMLAIACLVLALVISARAAEARGFDWFFSHVKPTGKCSGNEIPVSFYWSGRRTATGERFDANGNTAASRTLPFGTVVRLTHPLNGRSIAVRINDRGPYGIAHRLGIKLDLARGAARRLGLTQSGWVCVS